MEQIKEAVYLINDERYLHLRENGAGVGFATYNKVTGEPLESGQISEKNLPPDGRNAISAARNWYLFELSDDDRKAIQQESVKILENIPQAGIGRRRIWEPETLPKDIRLINSHYDDLYRIPDGGVIQVDYPDGRSFTARVEHLDDYHFDMGGLGNVFHICQFAEVMERNHADFYPEIQTQDEQAAWELGGKSPSIVDRGADIEVAARRIAWGKTLNAGQTCIAPDYLLIHRSLQDEFSRAFARALHRLHGDDAQQSLHYGRLVNDRAFGRVTSYLAQGKILVGGRTDPSDRYIEPTLLAEVDPGAPVMQEEIFGPVLPMLPFDDIGEAVALINDREKPLALYYFGPEKTGREVLLHTSSGGACINDTIMHIANDNLPFGGVGNSGMGRYHGRDSFDAFSLRRGVVESPARPDLPLRYPPYKGFRWVKKIL